MNRKVLCLIVVLMIFTSSITSFAITEEEASKWNYENASAWAKDELVDAVVNGIVLDEDILKDCRKNITRKEFSTLAVNLYRSIKMEDPSPAPVSTFSDTRDTSVRIAYKLGIINGVGNGKFAPDSPITREQMGIIMLNAVSALGVEHNKADGILEMEDKGEVSSWAARGVDFVYENGFMKGNGVTFNPKSNTPVEQAIAIVNRVYKEYADKKEEEKPESKPVANNYKEGITVHADDEGMSIYYLNTGNVETLITSHGKQIITKDGIEIYRANLSKAKVTKDFERVYFLDGNGYLTYYKLATREFISNGYDLGSIEDYTLVEEGKYKGYIITQPSKQLSEYIVYDNNLNDVGTIDEINYSDLNQTVDQAIAEAKYKESMFKFNVDGEDYFDFTMYGGIWDFQETLRMKPDKYSEGPIALVNSLWGSPIVHKEKGYYEVDMVFNNNDHSNAGIVFNVTSADVGNDQYRGYYVGINPKSNTLMFGSSSYGWHKLKEVELGIDIKPGLAYNLAVENTGDIVYVYLNGENLLTSNTGTINSEGYIGVRGWKADVTFESFYAY